LNVLGSHILLKGRDGREERWMGMMGEGKRGGSREKAHGDGKGMACSAPRSQAVATIADCTSLSRL